MCNQATVAAPGRLSALACETLTSSTIFHHLIVFALICRLGLLPCAINFDLCNPFPKPADIATSFSHRAKTYTGYRTTEESQNTQDISEKNKCIKMCQLCAIKTVTARDRWPKPLDHHKADVDFLVTTAHEEHDKTQAPATKENKSSKIIPASDELLDVLRMLNTLLATIEEDREAWWTSPAKRQMRKELELTCNQTKLSELHKVNNRVVEGLEGMEAKLGGFVKWGLGMNGGIWELVGSERVDCGGKEKLEGGSKVEVEVKKEKLAA